MTRLHQDDQTEPCFITDDELATWSNVLSKGEVERRLAGQHRPV